MSSPLRQGSYLVLPMSTGSTCKDRGDEVEPVSQRGKNLKRRNKRTQISADNKNLK
jgi:hypothetical protein